MLKRTLALLVVWLPYFVHCMLGAPTPALAGAAAFGLDSSQHPSATDSNEVDEQLYSRQMLVYGSSAQRSLTEATVLVYGIGYCSYYGYTWYLTCEYLYR